MSGYRFQTDLPPIYIDGVRLSCTSDILPSRNILMSTGDSRHPWYTLHMYLKELHRLLLCRTMLEFLQYKSLIIVINS